MPDPTPPVIPTDPEALRALLVQSLADAVPQIDTVASRFGWLLSADDRAKLAAAKVMLPGLKDYIGQDMPAPELTKLGARIGAVPPAPAPKADDADDKEQRYRRAAAAFFAALEAKP